MSVESFGAYDLTNYFTYVDTGIPFLRGLNIRNGFADFSDVLFIDQQAHQLLGKSAVHPGMVLLTMSGTVGNATVALDSWTYPVNSNQDIAKITPKPGVRPQYLAAFLGSAYGRIQMERLPVGSVQQHIFLWMIERMAIARLSDQFEKAVADAVLRAYSQNQKSIFDIGAAEENLLRALGLENWRPPEPLTYTRSASDVLGAGRFDAAYFSPAKVAALAALNRKGAKPLASYVSAVRDMVGPEISAGRSVLNYDVGAASFPVIDDQTPTVEDFDSAKKSMKPGDVVISRLRHYLRQIAVVRTPSAKTSVGSSEFIVLRGGDDALPPEALVLFLRTPVVQTILEYSQDGSQHPRFGDDALLDIPVPANLLTIAPALVSAVRSAHTARREAQELLARAQRAVEIAIEDSEKAALAYLSK